MIPEEKIPSAVPVSAIRKIEQVRNGTLAEAEQFQVTSLADSDVANVILRKLTAGIKLVNERFNEILRPQNEAVRQIRELRTQILTPLEEAKHTLSDRLMGWRAEENRRIAAETAKAEAKERERRALEEKHAANHREVPGPAPMIEKPAPLEARDTTKTRKQAVYKVVDFSKVPSEFRFNDLLAIRRKMGTTENEDGTTTSKVSVWATDTPGLFLFVNGDNIRNAASEIPGVKIDTKEIPVFA